VSEILMSGQIGPYYWTDFIALIGGEKLLVCAHWRQQSNDFASFCFQLRVPVDLANIWTTLNDYHGPQNCTPTISAHFIAKLLI